MRSARGSPSTGLAVAAGLGAAFFLLAVRGEFELGPLAAQKLRLFCRHFFLCPELISKPENEGGAGGETTALGVAEREGVDLVQLQRLIAIAGDGVGEISCGLPFRPWK